MAKKAEFPTYGNHEAAVCFNCSQSLAEATAQSSGYPVGEFKKPCPKCGMSTWYDVKKS